jgi:hypothetical protein
MNISNIINLILFALLFIFPLLIYYNLKKYKKASLGLLFSNKAQTKRAFQIFAVAMIIYAVSMLMLVMLDLTNIYILKTIYIITSVILTLTLIYVFYKLYRITKI